MGNIYRPMKEWAPYADAIVKLWYEGKTYAQLATSCGTSPQHMEKVVRAYAGRQVPKKKRGRKKELFTHGPREERIARSLRPKKLKSAEIRAILDYLAPLPDECPILGMPLAWDNTGKAAPDSPSIDRITPGGEYAPGNVAIMSWRANRIKSDSTADELRKIADWMDEQAGRQIEDS